MAINLLKSKWLMVLAIALFAAGPVCGQVVMNDHLFPPLAAAKPFSDFDAKGFLINGKRTFLVSAGIEYARVPHELWQDRLLRLKRAGFNSVEIYTLWNFHEPREGQFEFSGDQDLDQFLSLVKKLGMYAIVRVGPYYCAEWDHGGYPIWLRFKNGLRVREDNAEFEKYVDRFFDRLLPIVFKHQISKGGSVILVQLENEHPKGWGTVMPDNYFKRLQSKALSLGMQVPYLFSGVHHATDPAGEGLLDDATRPNPWFSTEFWSMWYTQYGAKPADAAIYDRRTWKIIAHGGGGYNFYMAHGGSNFGYTNNDEDAASYDYGAAVGQAGDLRPLYYTFKRAGFFARSFEEILENSSDATGSYTKVSADTAVKVTARTSKAGDLVFLDNPGKKIIRTTIHVNQLRFPVKLAPGEIYPIVHHYPVNSSVMLDWALSRVYAVVKQNKTTTVLVEASAGEQLALYFSVKGKAVINPAEGLKVSGNSLKIERTVKGPVEYFFKTGDQSVRVLVADNNLMDKTWLTDLPGAQGIITGISYLGKAEIKQGKLTAEAEYPLTGKKDGLVKLYLEKGSRILVSAFKKPMDKIPQVSLSAWENKNGSVPAMPGFDDQQWLYSENPLQMGADGDLTNAAWYRTKLDVPSSGKYSLQVDGGDRGTVFIDGKLVSKWKIRDGELSLKLEEGKHDLVVFTAHDGRDKMAAYLGPITDIDKKGLSGNVTLKKGGPFIDTLNHWYFTRSADIAVLKQGPPVLDTLKAAKYKIGADAFELKQGSGWFQTMIPAQEGLDQLTVLFKSVDENATVFINGQQVSHHEGWNSPFDFKITDPGLLKKPMLLSVFIENYDKEGGIDQAVKLNRIGTGIPVKGWRMHGGPDVPGVWKVNDQQLAGPQFFRSSFSLSLVKGQIWRVNPGQLSHGSVWINGHNLGRYPEKNGDIGLYIPEPWLKDGKNELVIYDEEGKTPGHVTVRPEPAAGRVTYQLTSIIN
jgi:beta-galactosidase